MLIAIMGRVILAVNSTDFPTSTTCVVVDAYMRNFATRSVYVQVDARTANVGEDLDGFAPLFLQPQLEQTRESL